jgi:CRISPR system Cascade subunit CasC
MTSVDGAWAVAHAITTHAVDSDIDWFTAVDDLVADAGEIGAGHLNTLLRNSPAGFSTVMLV